jgi:hypothetical protein
VVVWETNVEADWAANKKEQVPLLPQENPANAAQSF